MVCKAIKFYMEREDDNPLIADKPEWDKFLKNATRKEIDEMNRLICGVSGRLVAKWKSQS